MAMTGLFLAKNSNGISVSLLFPSSVHEARSRARTADIIGGRRRPYRLTAAPDCSSCCFHGPGMGDLGGLGQHDRSRAIFLSRKIDGALYRGFLEVAAFQPIGEVDGGED